ncbi:hypothetical protein NGRA_3182 [Nosema granulosis]|uniref:Uncharacterized protein n=1 Tax=Nosema granulosis TaxID=83296 RepID=A0A9P6GVR3_9MICR|nr:hypothetical protein NGRA_3182 [Nosema granulosis]
MIPQSTVQILFHGSVRSACGAQLTIRNKVCDMECDILGEKIIFSPLVTENGPKYIILGVDVLRRYPKPLELLMNKIKLTVNALNNLDNGEIIERTKEEESIMREYDQLFKDKIVKDRPCEVKKHQINTGSATPIFNRTGRIPIHYEKEVDKEIVSNLKLGIIKESDSPW